MTFKEQVQAVTRTVQHSKGSHLVELTQTFPFEPAAMWDALTSPEAMVQWFDVLSGDLEEGGDYELTGSQHSGTIKTCRPQQSLEVTWEYGEDVSNVSLSLTPTGSGTVLTLVHEVKDDEHWETFGPAATGIGWDGAFYSLLLYLRGDSNSNPEKMAELSMTPEGLQFVTDTAHAWRNAHIASGAKQTIAEGMAERTAKFYRGEGE